MDEVDVAGELAESTSDVTYPISLPQIEVEEQPETSEYHMAMEESEPGSDEGIDESEVGRLPEYDYQVFILSQYGKPVYASSGREDRISGVFGLISVFVNKVKSWEDTLCSFSQANLHVHFLRKEPLILCIVSKRPDWLKEQLEAVFNQLLATLSLRELKNIFQKKGDNYDLRKLIRGTQQYMAASTSSFRADSAVFLNAMRIFPLPATDREFLSSTLSQVLATEKDSAGLLFGLILAHRQLVTFVRQKSKQNLYQKDMHILMNIISTNKAFKTSLHSLPICLPHFCSEGFVHVSISYPWEGVAASLVLISQKRDSITVITQLHEIIKEKVEGNSAVLRSLTDAVQKPKLFQTSLLGPCGEHLYYFVYKNVSSQQLCSCGVRPPFVSRQERKSLNRSVALAAFLVKSKAAEKKASPAWRVAFLRRSTHSLLVRVTEKYEVIIVVSPVLSEGAASVLCDRLLKQLKSNESKHFITHSPTF